MLRVGEVILQRSLYAWQVVCLTTGVGGERLGEILGARLHGGGSMLVAVAVCCCCMMAVCGEVCGGVSVWTDGGSRSAAIGLGERVQLWRSYPDKRRRGRFELRGCAACSLLETPCSLALMNRCTEMDVGGNWNDGVGYGHLHGCAFSRVTEA